MTGAAMSQPSSVLVSALVIAALSALCWAVVVLLVAAVRAWIG